MFEINQSNLCEFAANGDLDNLKIICGYLDKNGKNEEFNLDIAGIHHTHEWDRHNNYAIRWVCKNGHLPIVRYLIVNYPQIDITAYDNCAIRWACQYGHIDLVKYLLENYPEVDITAYNNDAIIWACLNGHIDLVKYLLENYPEVDITAEDNFAICGACEEGHIDIIVYLLENYPEVDITTDNNYAIRWVCKIGHLPIVVYLLENYPEVDITAGNNWAIGGVCENGHIEIVKYLVMTCLKKILDKELEMYYINKIVDLLVENDEKIEYIMLMQELKKRNIKIDVNEKIKKMEEQIEKERNLFIQLEHHPQLPNGWMGIKCKEGLISAMDIVGKM